MKKISAEIVADSINQQGDRITTYLLTFPRFILAQLNTHRVFSKNSASSRAIPFEKMVEMVETDPCIPIAWQKPHKGMQGTEYYDHTLTEEVGELDYTNLPRRWLRARDTAVSMAKIMTDEGMNMPITKQLANRLLEPFMWHTVLLTGTEFENFFELRCPQYTNVAGGVFKSKKDFLKSWYAKNIGRKPSTDLEWLQINKGQAEVHMGALAEAMNDAMNESTPKELKAGEWHIPFGDRIDALDSITDKSPIEELSKEINHTSMAYSEDIETLAIKISTARCARLSYMTFDGEIDYEKDIKLHDTLLESQHMSPFEHCARAMSEEEYSYFIKGYIKDQGAERENLEDGYSEEIYIPKNTQGWCNNFKGFIQYRYLIENDYEQ